MMLKGMSRSVEEPFKISDVARDLQNENIAAGPPKCPVTVSEMLHISALECLLGCRRVCHGHFGTCSLYYSLQERSKEQF